MQRKTDQMQVVKFSEPAFNLNTAAYYCSQETSNAHRGKEKGGSGANSRAFFLHQPSRYQERKTQLAPRSTKRPFFANRQKRDMKEGGEPLFRPPRNCECVAEEAPRYTGARVTLFFFASFSRNKIGGAGGGGRKSLASSGRSAQPGLVFFRVYEVSWLAGRAARKAPIRCLTLTQTPAPLEPPQ